MDNHPKTAQQSVPPTCGIHSAYALRWTTVAVDCSLAQLHRQIGFIRGFRLLPFRRRVHACTEPVEVSLQPPACALYTRMGAKGYIPYEVLLERGLLGALKIKDGSTK